MKDLEKEAREIYEIGSNVEIPEEDAERMIFYRLELLVMKTQLEISKREHESTMKTLDDVFRKLEQERQAI